MKKTLAFFITIIIAVSLCATAFAAVRVPEYSEEYVFVTDNANVLSNDTCEYIADKTWALSEHCGAQIAVLTVDFLDGATSEQYAYTVFNEWGIGSAEENNGVLILLAVGEEKYWVAQGSGLEYILSSGTLQVILDEHMEPAFDRGNYEEAALATYDAIYEVLTKHYGEPEGFYSGGSAQEPVDDRYYEDEYYEDGSDFVDTIIGLIFIVVIVAIIIAIIVSLTAITKSFGGAGRQVYGRVYRNPVRPPIIRTPPRAPRPVNPRPMAPPRPARPSRPSGGTRSTFGGSRSSFGGSRSTTRSSSTRSFTSRPSRPSRPSGGSRPRGGGFGGGGSRGGGAGRK